jgi:predicted MFS family arabinose efflux permease
LFIVEGVATVGWAFCSAFLLLDFPANTPRLNARERELAISRLEMDNVTGRNEDTPRLTSTEALKQALTSWRVWILVAGYMVIVGSSTLSYFYPTLVQGLGYSSHMAQYMVVPIYAASFVAVGVTGYFSDKYPKQRGLIIAGWLSTSMVCSIVVCVVYDFKARYALLVLMAMGLWATNGCSLSYASSTFGESSCRVRVRASAGANRWQDLCRKRPEQ